MSESGGNVPGPGQKFSVVPENVRNVGNYVYGLADTLSGALDGTMAEEFGDKTIEQAEGTAWPDPPEGATRVMRSVHALRKKPIETLSAEDLRILLSQQVGLDLILPRTLDMLDRNPLVAGDFYPGDVLSATFRVDVNYWLTHENSTARLRAVVRNFEHSDDLDVLFPADANIWKSMDALRTAGILK